MRILGIYNNLTKTYIDFVLLELQNLGYEIDSCDIIDYSGHVEVKAVPTLFIIKSDIPAYPLEGKHDLQTVLNWAQAYQQ